MPKTDRVGHTQEAGPQQEPTLLSLNLRIPESQYLQYYESKCSLFKSRGL